jgi:hypothetical protein
MSGSFAASATTDAMSSEQAVNTLMFFMLYPRLLTLIRFQYQQGEYNRKSRGC